MEFFNKAKAVRLRSHHNKYLVADDDEETVRQSPNGSSLKARWFLEFVEGDSHLIRLKSCHGKYLTASNEPFLLGMTGNKVLQTIPSSKNDSSIEWEPRTEGFHVKLKTKGGKFLRANGSMPPWRNSVTHGVPHRTATQDWVLWIVDVVEILEFDALTDSKSISSSLSLSWEDFSAFSGSNRSSQSVVSASFGHSSGREESAMELFQRAEVVRLRSHHDKYLLADDDEESVCQDRNGLIKNARWTVELVENADLLRFKSCYGKYLTASSTPFLLGMTGKKVLQTVPRRLDSSVEWEPIREGVQVRLKTHYGHYLRANGGLPPWRNSITHDIPHRTATQDWVLWDVDVLKFRPPTLEPPPPVEIAPPEPSSPSSISPAYPKLSRLESDDSSVCSPVKSEGRVIYYNVADENGNVDKTIEEDSFHFKGSGLEELKQMLEEETGLDDILVCSQNPLNGKLYPLRLQLPPNNATMHVVVILSSSKAAKDIEASLQSNSVPFTR